MLKKKKLKKIAIKCGRLDRTYLFQDFISTNS